MGLSTPGIGSGLDIKAMTEAYVKAEIDPIQNRHKIKLDRMNTELSAVGQLKSHLATLQTSLATLSDISQLYMLTSSISDPEFLSTKLTSEAAKGSYQVEIQKLAQQQSLASAPVATTTGLVGNGTITIDFGTYSAGNTVFTANPDKAAVNIIITPGNDNLTAIRDAINNSDSGVKASIVQDDQGYRLTITSPQTGEKYAMKISGDVTAVNYDPTTGVNNMSETIKAENSLVKINGLTLTQTSNQLETAISGVSLTLKKAEVGKTISLNIADNQNQLTSNINDFIKKYNESISFLTKLTGYNTTAKTKGIFQGDPQFRALKLSLNKWATTPLENAAGPIKSLAEIGIVTTKDGLLELNQTKYQKALETNYQDIGALFAKTATASDSGIRINKVGSHVKAGTYDVNLTAFDPGVTLTGTIGGFPATSSNGMTLSGSQDLLGLSIDVTSGTIGARGEVRVKDGLAASMNLFLDTYMSSQGDLSLREGQLNKGLGQMSVAQDKINARSDSLTKRYSKQFLALDILLANLQSSSAALSQQLATLST